jgi:signal transduction histidine kinase
LVSMEERARWVGGSLRIESTPGEGTSVEAEIPLSY